MKKLNIKENGNFNVVSHAYVLYGRKHGDRAFVHLECTNGTTYRVDNFRWEEILRLVKDRVSWREFIFNVMYWYNIEEEFEDYYNI